MFKILTFSLLCIISLNANSIEKEAWSEASISYKKAQKGGEDDVLVSIDIFKKLNDSALKNAHIGSLTTMLARYTYLPWKKLSYVKDGSKLLDTAIRVKPDNLNIRFVRFYTYMSIPDFLGKEPFIQEDARYFIKMYKSKKLPQNINNQVLEAIVLFFHKYEDTKKRDLYLSYISDKNIKDKVSKKIAE